MHSGHGEDTPEERVVVLPSEQPQPPLLHGEHVQPAGGQPWGQATQPQPPELPPQPFPAPQPTAHQPTQVSVPQPAGPAAAEATQMLPPYPQGAPAAPPAPLVPPVPAAPPQVVEAEATQLLPPFPRSAPQEVSAPAAHASEAQPVAMPPAALPPAMAAHAAPTQQIPPIPAGAPFGVRPGMPGDPVPGPGPESAAESTQHLSIFAEQSYEQPYEQLYEQPYEQPHDAGRPAPMGGYDHLYRQDAPPRQPFPPAGPGAQHPPYDAGPYEPSSYDPADDGRPRRRLSPAALIGIVVGGCALAGLAAGAALSAGGDSGGDKGAQSGSKPPSATADASGGPGAGDSPAAGQAKALDALLNNSGSSRSSVINAVEAIKGCQKLDQAAADLRSAAGQRSELVTQLATLKVDQLPHHDELTDALNKAWQASAAADNHYAAWADQAAHDKKVCKGGHAHTTVEAEQGNVQSGIATQQKKRAVRLWNAIAKQYGLSERQITQI